MITLGIADTHTATACLLRDGHILGVISEERLNRRKGWAGVPAGSIRWLLKANDITGDQVDCAALSSVVPSVWDLEQADGSVLRHAVRSLTRVLPEGLLASDLVVRNYVKFRAMRRGYPEMDAVLREAGIDASKVQACEHHTTHAATAYFLAPFFDPAKQTLIITIDGSGDGLCASVSVGDRYRLRLLHAIASHHSIGEMYLRVTQYLGMKPLEHEYKVMGLAPYAPAEWADRAYEIFRQFYGLTPDGLSFENRTGRWGRDLLPFLEDRLRGCRFDTVAAAAQRLIEDIVVPFVRNWVARTGIRRVGCAGGVFMNVKTNMLISQLPEIEELFFMPTAGDESTCLGAALHAYVEDTLAAGREPSVEPVGTLYLGPEYGEPDIRAALDAHRDQVRSRRCDDIADQAARLLQHDQVLGRVAGRMEFGARSLGNRSILANPSDPRNVRTINRAIKMRDFWMPFCPSVLHERRHDYTVNPRDWPAHYMINAFPSTPLAFRELICGLHPSDLTCRPQFVTEQDNPGFYALLKAFERRTGIGGVLNTSFNLHGEPIVCTPADALATLLRCEIDFLVLSDRLIWRADHLPPDAIGQ